MRMGSMRCVAPLWCRSGALPMYENKAGLKRWAACLVGLVWLAGRLRGISRGARQQLYDAGPELPSLSGEDHPVAPRSVLHANCVGEVIVFIQSVFLIRMFQASFLVPFGVEALALNGERALHVGIMYSISGSLRSLLERRRGRHAYNHMMLRSPLRTHVHTWAGAFGRCMCILVCTLSCAGCSHSFFRLYRTRLVECVFV